MGKRTISTLLYDLADHMRTGTAGPFLLGLDLVFANEEKYKRVKNSGVISPKTISALYQVKEDEVTVMYLDNGLAIKANWPYLPAGANPGCRDAYGSQQYIPLMRLKIP